MSNYQGSVPETPRAADWRDDAQCIQHDPDLFFPKGYEGPWQLVIAQAKQVCRMCPVIEACNRWAFETRQTHGIWGGLTERERAAVLRRKGVRLHTFDEDRESAERTLKSIYDQHTYTTEDGHLLWEGSVPVYFAKRWYTAAQIVFTVDRGRPPVSIVRRTCTQDGCVLAAHLMDQRERNEARAAKELVS